MKGGTGAGPPGDQPWRAGLSPKRVRFSLEEFPSWVTWAGLPWAELLGGGFFSRSLATRGQGWLRVFCPAGWAIQGTGLVRGGAVPEARPSGS